MSPGTGTRTGRSTLRSSVPERAYERVAISLGILGVTAALQAVVFASSRSVALLADIIHNAGDDAHRRPARAIAFWLAASAANGGRATWWCS